MARGKTQVTMVEGRLHTHPRSFGGISRAQGWGRSQEVSSTLFSFSGSTVSCSKADRHQELGEDPSHR